MSLNKKEKIALLTAISFMHNYGEHFVALVKNGKEEENQQAWLGAKVIYKSLHKRIKESLKKDSQAPGGSTG